MGKSKIKVKIFFASKMLIDHLISSYLHHKSLLKGIDMAFVKKENRSMKLIPFVLALIPVIAFSKTRLEDYYFGFAISTIVDPSEVDAEIYDLSLNLPAFENSNIQFGLGFTDYDDDTSSDLGVDYLYRFEDFDGVVPFVGLGLNHVDYDVFDETYWNLYLGLEFSVSDQLTLMPKLRLHQGFDDDDDTYLEASIALTYWLADNHGLSLNYTHNSYGESDYLGLQYLYSWE